MRGCYPVHIGEQTENGGVTTVASSPGLNESKHRETIGCLLPQKIFKLTFFCCCPINSVSGRSYSKAILEACHQDEIYWRLGTNHTLPGSISKLYRP
jgi:hypothetical protein